MWRRLRTVLFRARADDELDQELRFHIEQRRDELIADGLSPAEARCQARREFGGFEQVKEECRDVRPLRWLESVAADLRYGLRSLRRTPAFTAVAIVSLAIGIGANTTIFSFVDAALLQRLPVREPERLVELRTVFAANRGWATNLPGETFDPLRAGGASFIDLFASYASPVRLRTGRGESEPANALHVSGNYFSVLGVRASLGRLLTDEDDRPGAPRAAVLTHDFWRRRHDRRHDVVGTTVFVDGRATTIVGVTAPEFVGVDRSFGPDVIVPLSSDRQTASLWMVGRLRPGVSIVQARERLDLIYRRALESLRGTIGRWPARDREDFLAQRLGLAPAGNGTVALRWQIRDSARILGSVVLLVLLIACTNVAALLLSRGERRTTELTVRLSLGAARSRVVRQLLTESLLLSALGGGAGLALAFGLHRLLLRLSPLDPSAVVGLRLNGHLLSFALLVCVATALATGLLPALRLTRLDLYPSLTGERRASARWRSGPARAFLVVQIAGSLALLAGAGLLLRSLGKLVHEDLGFDRAGLMMVRVDPAASRFHERPTGELGQLLVERVGALPGVRSAAFAANTVFPGRGWVISAWVDGHQYQPNEKHWALFNEAGPGFFATVGIPLRGGREFTARDDRGAPPVAVVNAAFAHKYFGETNPIGRRLGENRDESTRYQIVGVVGDSKLESPHDRPEPAVFLASRQQPRSGSVVLHLRTAGTAAVANAIRREIRLVDPALEIVGMQTVEHAVAETLQQEHMLATLVFVFSAIAVFLTAVGLYGTMAYATTRRATEIGIRVALGATRGRVVATMLHEAAVVVGAGMAIGLPLAAIGVRSLRSFLFGL